MTNPFKNDKIGEIFDYQIFKEGIVSYFEQFMQANQAYVALHGQLNLPLKPKTRVAIVTCMDSRLHVAQALGLAPVSYTHLTLPTTPYV